MHRRFSYGQREPVKRFKANHQITSPEIVVIDEAGTNLGVMKTGDALRRADEEGLDLIEVSPMAKPPVCRIMNLGKWQYLQSQKQKKQKTLETKSIRLTFKMAEHDMQVRTNQTVKFLAKGHKVKIEMRLRGRERAYPHQGKEIIETFAKNLGIPIQIESPAAIMGPSISTLIAKK